MSWRLLLLAVLMFAGYAYLPTNERIVQTLEIYLGGFGEEWRFYQRNPDPERLARRFHGLNFSIPRGLKKQLESEDVLAIPPRHYLLEFLSAEDIKWSELRWFYYAAGPVHVVPWEEGNLENVTHAVELAGRGKDVRFRAVPLDSPEVIERFTQLYREWGEP